MSYNPAFLSNDTNDSNRIWHSLSSAESSGQRQPTASPAPSIDSSKGRALRDPFTAHASPTVDHFDPLSGSRSASASHVGWPPSARGTPLSYAASDASQLGALNAFAGASGGAAPFRGDQPSPVPSYLALQGHAPASGLTRSAGTPDPAHTVLQNTILSSGSFSGNYAGLGGVINGGIVQPNSAGSASSTEGVPSGGLAGQDALSTSAIGGANSLAATAASLRSASHTPSRVQSPLGVGDHYGSVPPGMSVPSVQNWVYLDLSNSMQGPFPSTSMSQWVSYFTDNVMLRRTNDMCFVPFGALKASTGSLNPFALPLSENQWAAALRAAARTARRAAMLPGEAEASPVSQHEPVSTIFKPEPVASTGFPAYADARSVESSLADLKLSQKSSAGTAHASALFGTVGSESVVSPGLENIHDSREVIGESKTQKNPVDKSARPLLELLSKPSQPHDILDESSFQRKPEKAQQDKAQLELKQLELKQQELRQQELRQQELRQQELKQQELKQLELKHLELKQLEMRQQELKQQELKQRDLRHQSLEAQEQKQNASQNQDQVHGRKGRHTSQRSSPRSSNAKDATATSAQGPASRPSASGAAAPQSPAQTAPSPRLASSTTQAQPQARSAQQADAQPQSKPLVARSAEPTQDPWKKPAFQAVSLSELKQQEMEKQKKLNEHSGPRKVQPKSWTQLLLDESAIGPASRSPKGSAAASPTVLSSLSSAPVSWNVATPVTAPKSLAEIQKEAQAKKAQSKTTYAAVAQAGNGRAARASPSAAVSAELSESSASSPYSGRFSALNDLNAPAPKLQQPAPRPTRLVTPAKPISVTAAANQAKPTDELIQWAKISFKGVSKDVNPMELLDVFLSLPANNDAKEFIAESIYTYSKTIDGRRFAHDFLSKKKLAEQSMKPGETWQDVLKRFDPAVAEQDPSFRVVTNKRMKPLMRPEGMHV